MTDLDAIDSALLALLQNDGRRTNRELATMLNIAPSTCLERMRALRRRGLIVGYHAQVDLAAMDRVSAWPRPGVVPGPGGDYAVVSTLSCSPALP